MSGYHLLPALMALRDQGAGLVGLFCGRSRTMGADVDVHSALYHWICSTSKHWTANGVPVSAGLWNQECTISSQKVSAD